MKRPEKRKGPVPHRGYFVGFVKVTGAYIVTKTPHGPALRTCATLEQAKATIDRLARQDAAREAARPYGCESTSTAPPRTWLDKIGRDK